MLKCAFLNFSGTLPPSWDSKDVHGETSKKKEKPEKKDKDKDTVEKEKEEKGERKEKEQVGLFFPK